MLGRTGLSGYTGAISIVNVHYTQGVRTISEHTNRFRQTKKGYSSFEARRTAEDLSRRWRRNFNYYQCCVCESWHVGEEGRRNYSYPLGLELGDRVMRYLMNENGGNFSHRYRSIVHRILTAQ